MRALEAQYSLMRIHELEATIDEWFPPDIAAHLKEAIQEGGPDKRRGGVSGPADNNDSDTAADG